MYLLNFVCGGGGGKGDSSLIGVAFVSQPQTWLEAVAAGVSHPVGHILQLFPPFLPPHPLTLKFFPLAAFNCTISILYHGLSYKKNKQLIEAIVTDPYLYLFWIFHEILKQTNQHFHTARRGVCISV
jgi:hypothetical protein